MKFLLNLSKPEFCDCEHVLITLSPEDVKRIREQHERCRAFLKAEFPNPGDGWGHIDLSASFSYEGGNHSFDDIQPDLDTKGWLRMPDDAEFGEDDEVVRLECATIRHYDDAIYFRTLFKYQGGEAEAELTEALLADVEKRVS